MPNLVKGLGDRGFSGGDRVSRLDFINQIGLVGEIEVVKSNLCIDVWIHFLDTLFTSNLP